MTSRQTSAAIVLPTFLCHILLTTPRTSRLHQQVCIVQTAPSCCIPVILGLVYLH
jgi:hypothetical protein